jgi:hypothetical protein
MTTQMPRFWGGSSFAIAVMAMISALPATADAATWILAPTQDTWIFGTGTTNAVNHNAEGLRAALGGTTPAIPFLQFNLAQLPTNIQINSAHIELFLVNASSTNANNIFIDGYTNADAT